MELNVSEALRNPGQEYRFSGEQAIAPLVVMGDEIRFDSARLEGFFFTGSDGSVTVDGTLATTAHTRCANCLQPAQAELSIPFRETFLRDGDPEDDEQFAYTSSLVSFERLATSYAVLALPMRILCREDCPGITDWADVDPRPAPTAPGQRRPFAGLDQLLAQAQQNEEENENHSPDAPAE